MPSPIAHALAGAAAGWAVAAPGARPGRGAAQQTMIFAVAGMAADLDLLFGAHSGPTHGVGAALMAGVVAWVCLRRLGSVRIARMALAITLAYATHTLLDWLGTDSSPPIGIMALWPIRRDYYESNLHVFMAISRRYWLPEFWTYNLRALARELAILLPVAALVLWVRRRPA